MLATTSMEIYSANNSYWIPELEMEEENHFVHHQYLQVDSVDDSSKEFDFHHPLSSESYLPLQNLSPKSIADFNHEAPLLVVHNNNNKNKPKKNKSKLVSSNIICFGNLDSSPVSSQKLNKKFDGSRMTFPSFISSDENKKYSPSTGNEITKASRELVTRESAFVQEHALAERKRREKLSQHFITLSALIPGLKKVDKASILGDAVKYFKQLQEQVKTLEEQTSAKRVESVVCGKKSRFYFDDETSSEENSDSKSFDQFLPEIETRISEKDVLIRVHWVNSKGIMKNIIGVIEKLQLSVISSSALPFGDRAVDITIVAKMDAGYSMKVKDLARSLRQAFLNFM